MAVVGIRREDKSPWERRTPLVPEDVGRLVREERVEIHVERSSRRCFPDEEFERAGARLVGDLRGAGVVLGVKEIPPDRLAPGTTYAFFSHTIKGQPHNMPMLRRLLDLGDTLIDYELITDEAGARTIAFGRHAGIAGAIDTLWALGERFARAGLDTPLARVRPAVEYGEIAAAQRELEEVGRAIAAEGFPEPISPVTIAVTGAGGKVFGGAMEVLEQLPGRRVSPSELARAVRESRGRGREILRVPFGPEHLVEPARPGLEYSWEHYAAHPEAYRPCLGRHLRHLTAVVHGILWREGYPRFLLRADLARLYGGDGGPKLELITDITCDPGGSDEALVRVGDPGDPVYVFDPIRGEPLEGWTGRGPLVLAVDILPAEIPRDASRHFSDRLRPLVPALARSEPDPADRSLPGPLRRGILVHRGRLVPPWDARLAAPLARHAGPGAAA